MSPNSHATARRRAISIDAKWLANDPGNMRAGADWLIANVVLVFGAAGAHRGYRFANARGTD